jgi:hypothetical protein
LAVTEIVGAEDDDCADDGDEEEEDGKAAKFLLQGCADADAEESADKVGDGEDGGLEVAMGSSGAVFAALDRSDLAVLERMLARRLWKSDWQRLPQSIF